MTKTVPGIRKASSHQRALVIIATRTLFKQILPLSRYCQMVPSAGLKNSSCSPQTSLAYCLIKHVTHGLHQRLRSILPVSHLRMSGPPIFLPLFLSAKVLSHPHPDLLVLTLETGVPKSFAQGCPLHLNRNILIPHWVLSPNRILVMFLTRNP